jgi:predicted aspartyl protease
LSGPPSKPERLGPRRRTFLTQLALLGLGGAGLILARDRLIWPAPKVAFEGDAATTGWLGLPEPGGLVELVGRVHGTYLQVVVDSGAQYSAIDTGLAERLALPSASPIPMLAFGVSGQPSVTRSVKLDLDLGALKLEGLRAATLDLNPLSRLTRQPFSMLLGRDLLKTVVLEIDFPAAKAAFHRRDVWTPDAALRDVDVRSASGAIMAPVGVEDARPLEVMVDTGATSALALSAAAAQAAGVLDGRGVRTGRSVTLGGVSQDRVVTARRLSFAGDWLEDVELQIYSPAVKGPIPQGLLGLGVLKRYRVVLDHGGGRMFVEGPVAAGPTRRRRVRITPEPGVTEE